MDIGERPGFACQLQARMLFRSFEGRLLIPVHSHKNIFGRYTRIPKLFKVDDSGDKTLTENPYLPDPRQKEKVRIDHPPIPAETTFDIK